ncbi:MAG: hypothetical protein ACEPO8_01115 [Rhodothermaceae bacterium]
MKNSIKILFWAVFFIAALIGCSESPGDLGTDILKDDFGQDVVVVKDFSTSDTPVDQTSEVFAGPDTIATGSRGRVLLGKLDNINSKFLVKFNTTLPDSVLVPLKDNKLSVLSAKLEIIPEIIVGKEDMNSFNFEAFELADKINIDIKKDDQINTVNGNFLSNIVSTDTIITADIDKDIISEWLKEEHGDSTANYGALFSPGVSNNVVRIYSSILVDGTYNMRISYIVKKTEEWTDTLTYFPQVTVNIADGNLPNYSSDEMAVQGGVPSRANYWFNKEQLPQEIAVNKATLEFFVNEESSILRKTSLDTLELNFYTNAAKDTLDFGRGTTLLLRDKDNNSFKGDATQFIQRMIDRDYSYGFRIKALNEHNNVSKIILKNHLVSDPALKPKLTIKYSQKNK